MGAAIINSNGNSLGLKPAAGIYGTSVLTGHGYAVMGGVQFGTVYSLERIEDAEALLITKAADIANGMQVWYHINEFFAGAPGTQLYLVIFDPSDTDTNSLVKLLDKTSGPLPAIFNQIKGAALLVGVFRNLTSTAHTNGIDDDVFAAIAVAQDLAEAQRVANQPIDIFLEGQHLVAASSAAISTRTLLASWVAGLVIAQDPAQAALHANFTFSAAVGTALGVKAGGRTSRNIGYVQECNLQDIGTGRWVSAALSSGVPISSLDTDPSTGDYVAWYAKGYIVPRAYNTASASGIYFDTDPTCDSLTSNYNRVANSHTYNKAHRLVFAGVAPLINLDVDLDPTTGQLSPETCAIYENAGNDALAVMIQGAQPEVSGYQCKCDPNQNVLETGEVVVNFEIVPKGNAGTIIGNIAFVQALTQGA